GWAYVHSTKSLGKGLARKVRPSANRAAVALRLAASCLHHSQSALDAFIPRLKGRGHGPQIGPPDVAHPQVRRSLCGPGHGRVRADLPRAGSTELSAQSQGTRL